MDTDNLERYLNSFGKQVVNRAKGSLQKSKGGGTALENSISFKVLADNSGFTIQFFMNSYGTFVDKGVSGTAKNRKYKDYENKTESSPYRYSNKQPPPDILARWISKKGIKGRDKKTGRFISNMSLAFLMGRAIKRDGIQGISFFQKPLGLGLKQFGKEMLGAVEEDIIKGLTTVK
jgi:hypothetical protein|tara:strand:- start:606 stop:1133 length:528 start_codon:yes stop_codon:yes gene_type:complete